jgi:hypothetical protein
LALLSVGSGGEIAGGLATDCGGKGWPRAGRKEDGGGYEVP